MTQENHKPVHIFVSYSHKDEAHRVAFDEAVSILRRRGLVSEWFDGKIVPGEAFEPEILRQLSRAEIVVLLLSPSYVNSDFCWGKELRATLENREHRDVRVVGVVVRPVHLAGTEICRHKLPAEGHAGGDNMETGGRSLEGRLHWPRAGNHRP